MILIIFLGVLFFTIGFGLDWNLRGELPSALLDGSLFSTFAIVAAFIISSSLAFFLPKIGVEAETVLIYQEAVYSLEGENDFTLGAATTDSYLTYFLFTEKSEGWKMQSFDSEEVFIKETIKQPIIQKYKKDFKNKFLSAISFGFAEEFYILHLPKDLAIVSYNSK